MKKIKSMRFISAFLGMVMALEMQPLSFLTADAATAADMTISENGISFICAREGFSSKCYYDGAQSSIGYGTKCGSSAHASGMHSITREAAMEAMMQEINNQYVPNVRRQTTGIQMNQNQFDALVSFTYNTGGGTSMIKNSPLVKYLRNELSEAEARSQFAGYIVTNSATKKVDQGLINRRNAEADLFFSGPSYHDPEGYSDTAEGGHGTVRQTGWTLDRDDPNASIDIHVYMDGPAGVGRFIGSATADQESPDVAEVIGIGGNHRYDVTFNLDVTGEHTFYVYGINVGGGNNAQLINVLTANILEKTSSTFTDVHISDVSPDGYTVNCTLEDASGIQRVLFPTWTAKDGQDDILWNEGTANGNTYSYRVNISDHNNEHGEYATHIYAYNNSGNVASTAAPIMILETTKPTISDVKVIDKSKDGYTVQCKVTDEGGSGIDRVLFPTWTLNEPNEQDDLLWAEGTINGDIATFFVNVSDHNGELGTYRTHIYAYDKSGNATCVAVDDVLVEDTPVASAPTQCEMTVSKAEALVGETVAFVGSSDADTYTLHVLKNGKEYMTESAVNAQANIKFDEAGTYTAYMTAANNKGNIDSNHLEFTISATITMQSGKKYELPYNSGYSFRSSDPELAVVSKSGVITAFPNVSGDTIITAIDENSDTYEIHLAVENQQDTSDTISSEEDASESSTQEVTLYGDVDESGNVDIIDVILLNRSLMTGEPITAQGKANADVDKNGIIDETDSLNILKAVVELVEL